jgi:hypothetical protein
MDTENKSNHIKIEESFLDIINGFEESYSGLFIKGVTDPEVIKEGDLEKIGRSLKRMSEFLDTRLQDLEFQPEYKTSRIKPRLEKAVKSVEMMGNEIESMKTKEPEDYHWYIVGALAVVLIGLFDYIEIYME